MKKRIMKKSYGKHGWVIGFVFRLAIYAIIASEMVEGEDVYVLSDFFLIFSYCCIAFLIGIIIYFRVNGKLRNIFLRWILSSKSYWGSTSLLLLMIFCPHGGHTVGGIITFSVLTLIDLYGVIGLRKSHNFKLKNDSSTSEKDLTQVDEPSDHDS